MSTVNAFFSQRKKDLASGKGTRDTATAEKLFGVATPAVAPAKRTLHVAVQGCCHGELHRIYDACAAHERETGKKIDFLICCGDFQSTRSPADLASMAVPDKYKTIGDFPQYYRPMGEGAVEGTGESDRSERLPAAVAPYLTLFVGGNHENSDWLAEESYGGFLAPNIYYLGHSGVVEVDGKLRVGGLSGIFKAVDFGRPYPSERPYAHSESGKRSAYHVRRIEQDKLMCYCRARELIRAGRQRHDEADSTEAPTSEPAPSSSSVLVDVMVSHDWPAGITKYGDEEQLLRYKPYFREEVSHNALGNPHTMALLRAAKPQHWLAAHLHCFFTATVQHAMASGGGQVCKTCFMALDKCAKGKGFLDFLDIPIVATAARGEAPARGEGDGTEAGASSTAEKQGVAGYAHRVRRDPVWLAVLRHSHRFLAANRTGGPGGFEAESVAKEIAEAFLAAPVPPPPPHGTHHDEGAAASALTTGSLLRALGLAAVAPLQLPLSALPSANARALPWRGQGSACESSGAVHPASSVRSAAPPRVLPTRPPSTAAAAAETAATPLEPLGWAEDLG